MATRYTLSSNSAILASTILFRMKHTSERSVVIDTRVVNSSSRVSRNPRKIFTMYDRTSQTISVFTSPDEILEEPEPVKIRLSTNRLGPAMSRQFPDAGLLTLAACSSAETVFLAGSNPPEISRTFFSFHPRYPPTKASKNRVLWVESFAPTEQDSISGLRTTRCFVKMMSKMQSGTVLKVFRVRKIGKDEPLTTVDYDDGEGRVYKLRQNFVNVLNGLTRPFSEQIRGLIVYENARSIYSLNHLSETFVNYLRGRSSPFLWSMLQWSACFGDKNVMGMITLELATRLNNVIRNGFLAVQNELGIGGA